MNSTWLKHILPNTLILTPNSRLARFLLMQYHHNQTDANHPTPRILPISRWLEQCYQDWLFITKEPLQLLSSNQELFIWESIIHRNEKDIFQPGQIAQACMQAYEFLKQANLSLDILSAFGNVDVASFISWAIEFEHYCKKHDAISKACLPQLISDAVSKQQLTLHQAIYLVSFDDFSPQIVRLFDILKMQGTHLTQQELGITVRTQQQLALADTHDEINTMARWAKHIHEQDPSSTITCIVPKLNNLRPQLLETFQAHFPKDNIFNISGGDSLAQTPIIKAALYFLQLNIYSIDCSHYTSLLNSPFIKGYDVEYNARALFDSELRNLNEPEISCSFLLDKASQHQALSLFREQMKHYFSLRKELPKRQTLAQWSELFLTLLTSIGWPGDQPLSSEEHQQIQRWYELLHELGNLSLEEHLISYQTAISTLSHYTQKVLFQKETHDGPIQVLGLLEAAGLVSDYIWVMGLDSETWPQSASPNPFLPSDLQRQHHMPHSTPERELLFAQKLMHRFSHSAQHVFYSYHRHDAERELSPSPLLKRIPEHSLIDLQLPTYHSKLEILFMQRTQESLSDAKAPSFKTDEIPKGGSGIFTDQAACPFRAFAHYRLKAHAPITPEMGLDHLERGSLLHACLDHVWSELKTHEYLCQIKKENLEEIISQSIEASFHDLFPYSRKLQPIFKHLEMQRLQQLISKWLDLEKQRDPFQVVAHEQTRRIQIGQLNIKLQIDRIDELADGQRLLLDYKTGRTNPAEWFGSRPRAPQLPLYAVTEKKITALAFAQVRIDEMCFKGVSEDELNIAGIKIPADFSQRYEAPSHWSELLEEWHAVLEKLADDYYQGIADVDPVNATTCTNCDLHALCRIAERVNYDQR